MRGLVSTNDPENLICYDTATKSEDLNCFTDRYHPTPSWVYGAVLKRCSALRSIVAKQHRALNVVSERHVLVGSKHIFENRKHALCMCTAVNSEILQTPVLGIPPGV